MSHASIDIPFFLFLFRFSTGSLKGSTRRFSLSYLWAGKRIQINASLVIKRSLSSDRLPDRGLNPRSSASFPTNGATKSEPIYNSALSFHSRFVKFYDDNKVFGMASLSGRPSVSGRAKKRERGNARAWVGRECARMCVRAEGRRVFSPMTVRPSTIASRICLLTQHREQLHLECLERLWEEIRSRRE